VCGRASQSVRIRTPVRAFSLTPPGALAGRADGGAATRRLRGAPRCLFLYGNLHCTVIPSIIPINPEIAAGFPPKREIRVYSSFI